MAKEPPTLSDFGFEIVVTYFKLTKEQHNEHAAMLAVFRDCVDFTPTLSDAVSARRRAAEIAIQKIEPRYRLFTEYADDFFKDRRAYSRESLVWAVIANEQVCTACANPHDFGPNIITRVLNKGQRIWEDACAIRSDEQLTNYTFAPESFFLAHVDATEEMYYFELHFKGWPLNELIETQKDGFSVLKKFLRADTEIGKELAEKIRVIEEKIAAFIDSQPPTPKPSGEVIAFRGLKR